jgi:hypothetical protein
MAHIRMMVMIFTAVEMHGSTETLVSPFFGFVKYRPTVTHVG